SSAAGLSPPRVCNSVRSFDEPVVLRCAAANRSASSRDEMELCSGSSLFSTRRMIVQNIEEQVPFTTKDSSTIRSILDRTNAPLEEQSLEEASLPADRQTQRHYHRLSEEINFFLAGQGTITVNDEKRFVAVGDAILIPAGAWHSIAAVQPL